jgi:hypothetical protein
MQGRLAAGQNEIADTVPKQDVDGVKRTLALDELPFVLS